MANEDVDYWVSKVKWDVNRLDYVYAHKNNNNSVGSYTEMSRSDILYYLNSGYIFYCILKKENGSWTIGNKLYLDSNNLKWDNKLPLLQTKRKCFVSYYHNDDKYYKESFLNLMDDLTVTKSVKDGDIDSNVSDNYAKQLIQKGYLSDTTVLIVLIGMKTKCRKHVDWEISGALNYKVGESYAGLLGLLLPEHDDYGKDTYNSKKIPARLADNLTSGYAILKDYTTDTKKLQEYIELAYNNRKNKTDDKINSRKQMPEDTCK